jgi:hypothetical protein
LELATIFYYFRFDTSLFVASYDSQGHGGGWLAFSELHAVTAQKIELFIAHYLIQPYVEFNGESATADFLFEVLFQLAGDLCEQLCRCQIGILNVVEVRKLYTSTLSDVE